MSIILFLTGDSRGDALNKLGQAYEGCFRHLGYDFLRVDFRDCDAALSSIQRIITEQPIEFVFSMMGHGSDVGSTDGDGQSQNLWHAIGAPFLSLIGDSPAYFFDLHVARFPGFACLYGFPEHEQLRRRLPQAGGYIGGCQSPLLETGRYEEIDFRAKTEGQLIFLKNGNDPKQLWDSWEVLRGRPLRVLRELASYLAANLSNPAINQIDDVLVEYFKAIGLDLSALTKLRLLLVAQLDDYLRRVKSTMMAKALMDFPVQIIGENWDHLDFSNARATYVKSCNFAESNQLIGGALGLIDMSPNTGLAPHDRACRAYSSYTLCITNEQEFFRGLPHSDQFSFRFDRDSFQTMVAEVLAHPSRFVDIGIDVAHAYREANSSEKAAQRLIDVASMIRLDQRREPLPALPNYFSWPPSSLS